MRNPTSLPEGPKWVRRLLRVLLGSGAAPEALAALDELYRVRARHDGPARARRWYWRQLLGLLVRWRSLRNSALFRAGPDVGGGGGRPAGVRRSWSGGGSPPGVLLQDLRGAVRALQKAPAFTLVSTLTLGLGIGVTLAMFGILDAALLRPLPFSDSDRLVIGRATVEGRLNPWVSAPDFLDYRERAEALGSVAAILPFAVDATITGGDEAERITGTTVSPGFFRTLEVSPQVGRDFTEEEGSEGAPNVLMLSHAYWVRRFGGSPDAVGRTLTVDDSPFTVVGIMPADFHFLMNVDFWLPLRPDRDAASMRDRHNWLVLGRLSLGVTLEQAQSNVDLVSSQLQEAYPETNASKALLLTDLRSVLLEDHGARLTILTLAAVLVLLLACGNVTGMMLARAPARARELSIRSALGAGRGRLARGLLLESLMLSSAGGLLGLGLALVFQQLALDYLKMDRLGLGEAGLSTPVLLFALVLSQGAGVVAGLYPSLRGARRNLSAELKAGARSLGGGGTGFRSGLVVTQIAFSVVLLAGSGLLIRSLAEKRAVNPGFDPVNALTAEIRLPAPRYPMGDPSRQFFSDLVAEISTLPGVASASAVSHLPILHPRNVFRVKGPYHQEDGQSVFLRAALPGYFETMAIPLEAGRGFQPSDGPDDLQVAVINRAMAQAFFPDENPLGKQLELDRFGTPTPLEVVGMVGDVRMSGLDLEPGLALYLPHAQLPYRTMQLVVRTAGDGGSVAGMVRSALRRADADLPLPGLATLDEVVGSSVAEDGLVALCITLYALLPLLMAAVGLYAVVAYYVSQRLHEIGIRMALGADPGRIGALVARKGLALVGVGLAVGLGAAFALTRFLQQMLFEVGPTDPMTFAVVTLLIGGIALLACAVPTLRAVRSDPKAVLNAG